MSFIHFGCWNYGFCNTGEDINGLSRVMSQLKHYNEKVNFVVIAGDNYYDFERKEKKDKSEKDKSEKDKSEKDKSEKDKSEKPKEKIKIFNKVNFKSGVNCLNKALPNTIKYILLGNHEYDKMESIEVDDKMESIQVDDKMESIQIDDKLDKGECNLMKFQKNTFNEKDKYVFFENVIETKLENTLIIMIDSTLYEMAEDKKPNLYCLNVFPEIERNYETLIKEQEKQIIEILTKNRKKNIIIIGHHPIITSKISKKGERKNKILNGLLNLFINISKYFKISKDEMINIYYLCADNHLRQEGIIQVKDISINQYVSGTGGAELDYCTPNEIMRVNDLQYKITLCNETYGFYHIEEKDGELKFNFIDVGVPEEEFTKRLDTRKKWVKKEESIEVEIFKQKYLKYKQKYLQLKKSLI
jgi:hypothetical protein